MRAFFYDTWAFIALANADDPHHDLCAEGDRALEEGGYVATTSDYVLDETLTGLHVGAGSRVALELADLVEARIAGGDLKLLEVTSERRAEALRTFRRLCPKSPRLSFTDCTSFVLMRELRMTAAFTADRHFHLAGGGIRPLLERHKGILRWKAPD
ncbi:MAG: type II toxin-antitoxin system VapC family toxin [Deltaproteobacteria bacterium]|nr:type II toxin-antitoxin system VapC family toxin [Deltaproteobacteria bacterium]